MNNIITVDNDIDDIVDKSIQSYLNLDTPKSFFLFAGAGAGKTTSLTKALSFSIKKYSERLSLNRQKIGVITYTNVACEAINEKLGNNSLVSVSTIHSFCWELIKGFNADIKKWVLDDVENRIDELQEKLDSASNKGTKTYLGNEEKKIKLENKKENIHKILRFNYSPDSTDGDLNHSEVIKITVDFLKTKSCYNKF